jgi:hypothetical protein
MTRYVPTTEPLRLWPVIAEFFQCSREIKKLLWLANAMQAGHAGRLDVGAINKLFGDAGGSYEEYGSAVKGRHGAWLDHHASVRGLLVVHASRGGTARGAFLLSGNNFRFHV